MTSAVVEVENLKVKLGKQEILQFSQVHQVPKEPREIEKLLDSLIETITADEEYKEKYKFDKIESKLLRPDLFLGRSF